VRNRAHKTKSMRNYHNIY